MLASTVSSVILRTMAEKENLQFEDTLTGFKWMGSRAKELIDQGKKVIFAFEEAIGFMFGQNVLDKDGVSAAAVMAEIITTLHEENISLSQQLGTEGGTEMQKVNAFFRQYLQYIWVPRNKQLVLYLPRQASNQPYVRPHPQLG
jgi:phosphomannomutase